MDWDAFQAFLAVARTGRISAAARRLAVQHTTIARRLSALEVELGVSLFYRTNTGYTLTTHGQAAQAEAMEHAALALAARARESGGAMAGHVRIAMAPEFALVDVSDDVASQDVWLIAHPEFRRDPKVRAVADFVKRIARAPTDSADRGPGRP